MKYAYSAAKGNQRVMKYNKSVPKGITRVMKYTKSVVKWSVYAFDEL